MCGTWLRPPFEGLSQPGWGLVLCLVLLLTALGATWRVLAPGGITPGERRAHNPRFRRAMRLFGALVLAAPWLITAGAALFVVPLRPPRTVVLVSRSRVPPPSYAPGQDPWETGRRKLAEDLRDAPRPFDAGPLVDEALGLLRRTPSAGWTIDDPATAHRVAEAVRQVLADRDLPPLSAEAGAPPVLAPAEDLPRWLVESTEISLLHGLTRRYNVERIHALVAQRRTAVGHAWDGVAPLLAGGAQCPLVKPIPVADQQPFTLQSALRMRTRSDRCPAGNVEIEIALVTAPSPPSQVPMILRLYAAGRLLAENRSALSLRAEEHWVRQSVCFALPGGQAVDRLTDIEIRTPEPVQVLPVQAPYRSSRSAPEPWAAPSPGPVRVLVRGDALRDWKTTLGQLLAPSPQGAVLAWRERMEVLGFDLSGLQGGNHLDFFIRECGTHSADAGEVTVDACEPNLGIWIYPSSFDPKDLEARKLTPGNESDPILRGHVPPLGLPGTDSWEGVPLAPGTFSRPSHASFLPLAEAYVLPALLLDGSSPRDNLAWPVVTSAELPDASGRTVRVTHLGFDPSEQGLFLGPYGASPGPGFDPHRFLAAWTQILEAVYTAAADVPAWHSDDASSALNHPRTFLSGNDLARISGRSLWLPWTAVVLGVLLYALLVMLGLRTLPTHSRTHEM